MSLSTATITDERPSILIGPRGEDLQQNIGQRLEWCVSGRSFGVHDLKWTWSQNPSLETVNISANVSDSRCVSCECADSIYYNSPVVKEYLRTKTVNRSLAFSVLGYTFSSAQFDKSWQCSGIPTNFLSFVIIDRVMPTDDQTELVFNVTSFTEDYTPGRYRISACTFMCM